MAGSSIGSITYLPVDSSIPTLSGAMLVVLSLLFAVVAYRVLRTRSGNGPLASIVAFGIVALGASSGIYYTQNVQAAASGLTLIIQQGGTVNVPAPGLTYVQNLTSHIQRITNIYVNPNYTTIYPGSSPECAIGLEVPPNTYCYIDFELNPE